MRRILTAATLVALALAMPGQPARADHCTTNPDGRQVSCVDPTPQCNFNPSRQEWFCSPRGAVRCSSPQMSWACMPGARCVGDGTTQPRCR